MTFRSLKLLQEEFAGIFAHGHEALAPLPGGNLFGRFFLFLYLNVIFLGQIAERLRVRHVLIFHHKAHGANISVEEDTTPAKVNPDFPVLTESKGPNPIEFENGYVAFEDLPEKQRYLPGEEPEDLDDEDFEDEEEGEEDEEEEDEDGKEIFDENE